MLPTDVISLAAPALYYRERVFPTELVDPIGARHFFGGKLGLSITGEPHGPYPLHRIMTIDLTDECLGIADPHKLGQVPLIFGIRYQASEMRYDV